MRALTHLTYNAYENYHLRNNEVLAREGIDTSQYQVQRILRLLGNNEVLAREGIDTSERSAIIKGEHVEW